MYIEVYTYIQTKQKLMFRCVTCFLDCCHHIIHSAFLSTCVCMYICTYDDSKASNISFTDFVIILYPIMDSIFMETVSNKHMANTSGIVTKQFSMADENLNCSVQIGRGIVE